MASANLKNSSSPTPSSRASTCPIPRRHARNFLTAFQSSWTSQQPSLVQRLSPRRPLCSRLTLRRCWTLDRTISIGEFISRASRTLSLEATASMVGLVGAYSPFSNRMLSQSTVFLGSVPESTDEWINSTSLVGIHDVFARQHPQNCANCRSRPDALCEGAIFLGPALHRANLSSFDPDVVVPYLTENLHWRASKESRLPASSKFVLG